MIHEIFPKSLDNQYHKEISPEDDDFVLIFKRHDVLIKDSDLIEFPSVGQFRTVSDDKDLRYLFRIDDKKYFASPSAIESDGAGDVESLGIQGFKYANVRNLRAVLAKPKDRLFAAITGKHICDWYRDNVYCGRCGQKMHHSEIERAMVCDCGYTCYPRIMPAVIVAVTNGDKILLTKYSSGYKHYALIAGFNEIGETLEETVSREVMEEVGLKVKNITYYKSQPWGIANDLLAGYFCELDGDDKITLDERELAHAEWVDRKDVPGHYDDFALTNEMMMYFAGKFTR